MNQSLTDLNPNRISKLLQADTTKEELIPGHHVPGSVPGENVDRENHVDKDTTPRTKKVAKVKPNPRIVENLELTESSRGVQELTDGNVISSPPPEIGRPLSTPGAKIYSNPASPLFESAVNTECIQLIRQLWTFREEVIEFLHLLSTVLTQCRKRLREVEGGAEGQKGPRPLKIVEKAGKLPELTPVELSGSSYPETVVTSPLLSLLELDDEPPNSIPSSLSSFILTLQSITASFIETEKQFQSLSAFRTQCKIALYAKVLHARKYVAQDHLSVLHTIHQLITTLIHLLAASTPSNSISAKIIEENLASTLLLTEAFNSSLESLNLGHATVGLGGQRSIRGEPAPPPPQGTVETKTGDEGIFKIRILRQVNDVIQNDTPSLTLSLKPFSAIKILNVYLTKRVGPVSRAFTAILQSNFLKGGSAPLTPEKFNDCFAEEESRLGPLTSGFLLTSSLLGRAAIKKSSANGEQRLSKSVRAKIVNYYRETLWKCIGGTSSDLMLWGHDPPTLPFVLFPWETFIDLRNSLSLGGQISGSKVSPILTALDSVSSSLHSFSLLLSWDEKLRTCFEIATKIKRPEQVNLRPSPDPGEWATLIGSKFGEIVTTSLTLLDGFDLSNPIHPTLPSPPQVSPSTPARFKFGDKEDEELLSDEAQQFFRLDATLTYFISWVMKRSKSWLNSWAIPEFLAASQRDTQLLWQLLKSYESILITREALLNSEITSVRLSAKQRLLCAEDLRDSFHLLHELPNELLEDVGPICQTLSLATLQSCMPVRRHWEGIGPGSGLNPEKPSAYVQVFIGHVIEPVFLASVQFVNPSVQEAVGKHVVQSSCEAWLEYIQQKKIRFSEWGAVQLLCDFVSLREWIRKETSLDPDALNGILQLEILKRCEGVAFLLLRSPGDVLGVGKQLRKARRISSNSTGPTTGSTESSPSQASEGSISTDDIPPEMYVPNQQMWLKLRLRQNALSFCC